MCWNRLPGAAHPYARCLSLTVCGIVWLAAATTHNHQQHSTYLRICMAVGSLKDGTLAAVGWTSSQQGNTIALPLLLVPSTCGFDDC